MGGPRIMGGVPWRRRRPPTTPIILVMLTSPGSIPARQSRTAQGPLLQGLDHALEGDLAVRALDELGDLIPVDSLARAEVEGEPTAGTEVGGHVEAPVLEERGTLVGLGLEDDAPRPLVGAGEDCEQLLAGTEGRSPPRLDLARLGERQAQVA